MFSTYLQQDPELANRPNGLIMAAKAAMTDLGLTEGKKVKTEARKELLNQLETGARQTVLKGSGAPGKISREQGVEEMSDPEFERFVRETKYKGG